MLPGDYPQHHKSHDPAPPPPQPSPIRSTNPMAPQADSPPATRGPRSRPAVCWRLTAAHQGPKPPAGLGKGHLPRLGPPCLPVRGEEAGQGGRSDHLLGGAVLREGTGQQDWDKGTFFCPPAPRTPFSYPWDINALILQDSRTQSNDALGEQEPVGSSEESSTRNHSPMTPSPDPLLCVVYSTRPMTS